MKKGLEPRSIDWPEYGRLCQLIADRVKSEFRPDSIVGIAQGGVIAGATIASLLKLDFFPIKFSRKVSEEVVRKRPKLTVPATAQLEGKRVLLVDDWSDSGETIRAAAGEIGKFKPAEISSAVLVRSGEFQPDYYAAFVSGSVVFPWEESPHPSKESEDQ